MSDVKRYQIGGRDIPASAAVFLPGEVVSSTDYDALLAERDQLRAERDSHQRLCIAEMEKNSQHRAELEAIRGQPSAALIEAVRDLIGASNSVNRSRMHEVRGHDDDQPRYWQRKEWVDWLVENGEKAQQALDALPPQQPDAVSVPRELLERVAAILGSQGFSAWDELAAEVLLSTKNAEEVDDGRPAN